MTDGKKRIEAFERMDDSLIPGPKDNEYIEFLENMERIRMSDESLIPEPEPKDNEYIEYLENMERIMMAAESLIPEPKDNEYIEFLENMERIRMADESLIPEPEPKDNEYIEYLENMKRIMMAAESLIPEPKDNEYIEFLENMERIRMADESLIPEPEPKDNEYIEYLENMKRIMMFDISVASSTVDERELVTDNDVVDKGEFVTPECYKRKQVSDVDEDELATDSADSFTLSHDKGSMATTDKSKSIIGSQVLNNTEKVPTGFYLFTKGETPVFLLMDHHGELFLIQKGKVHWSHKTNVEMYSLFVGDGVNDYLDAGEDMFSYRHTPGLPPEVISYDSLEDLRVKLKRIYGSEIRATSKLVELDLDYQTGELSDESTSERFLISIIKYEILLSSLEPPTLRWHLVFAEVNALFPNTDFPVMVLYTRNVMEFTEICQKFDIKRLPGGRTIDDMILNHSQCKVNTRV